MNPMNLTVIPSTTVLDQPMSKGLGWAVAQLAEPAALVTVATIERDLLRHTPQAEMFFPAVTDDGFPSPLHPLSAYVFALANLPDNILITLERSRYVEGVLRGPGGRKVSKVTDADIQKALRSKLKEDRIEIGQSVIVLSGDWAGIEGKVADVKNGRVTILIELRSTRTLIKLAVHELQFL